MRLEHIVVVRGPSWGSAPNPALALRSCSTPCSLLNDIPSHHPAEFQQKLSLWPQRKAVRPDHTVVVRGPSWGSAPNPALALRSCSTPCSLLNDIPSHLLAEFQQKLLEFVDMAQRKAVRPDQFTLAGSDDNISPLLNQVLQTSQTRPVINRVGLWVFSHLVGLAVR